MKEDKKLEKDLISLSDNDLEKVTAGADTDSLRKTGKAVPLPEAKSKKEIDGGYAGIIISESTDTTIS